MADLKFNVTVAALPESGYSVRIPEGVWKQHEPEIRRLRHAGRQRHEILEFLQVQKGLKLSGSQLEKKLKEWDLLDYNLRHHQTLLSSQQPSSTPCNTLTNSNEFIQRADDDTSEKAIVLNSARDFDTSSTQLNPLNGENATPLDVIVPPQKKREEIAKASKDAPVALLTSDCSCSTGIKCSESLQSLISEHDRKVYDWYSRGVDTGEVAYVDDYDGTWNLLATVHRAIGNHATAFYVYYTLFRRCFAAGRPWSNANFTFNLAIKCILLGIEQTPSEVMFDVSRALINLLGKCQRFKIYQWCTRMSSTLCYILHHSQIARSRDSSQDELLSEHFAGGAADEKDFIQNLKRFEIDFVDYRDLMNLCKSNAKVQMADEFAIPTKRFQNVLEHISCILERFSEGADIATIPLDDNQLRGVPIWKPIFLLLLTEVYAGRTVATRNNVCLGSENRKSGRVWLWDPEPSLSYVCRMLVMRYSYFLDGNAGFLGEFLKVTRELISTGHFFAEEIQQETISTSTHSEVPKVKICVPLEDAVIRRCIALHKNRGSPFQHNSRPTLTELLRPYLDPSTSLKVFKAMTNTHSKSETNDIDFLTAMSQFDSTFGLDDELDATTSVMNHDVTWATKPNDHETQMSDRRGVLHREDIYNDEQEQMVAPLKRTLAPSLTSSVSSGYKRFKKTGFGDLQISSMTWESNSQRSRNRHSLFETLSVVDSLLSMSIDEEDVANSR